MHPASLARIIVPLDSKPCAPLAYLPFVLAAAMAGDHDVVLNQIMAGNHVMSFPALCSIGSCRRS
uniref:Uncharacterized protein n=1 Tax=Arundo donax TaxID=35708 RepID=A0A0A8YYM6_ARUDO